MKYLKWIYGTHSNTNTNLEYKIDEVTIAEKWNLTSKDWEEQGGLNFTNEENALRWISRGDTLYDVIIPNDAEVINVRNDKTPNGIYRSNKIIVTNPRKVTDELTMELYKKSNMPELTYYKTLSALAMKGCYNTCLEIIRDKVNKDNIDLVINDYEEFNKPGHNENMNETVYNKILEILKEIKSDLLICLTIDKMPYEKNITNDNIINVTGQSGTGKSYFCQQYKNHLIIDTDEIFSEDRFKLTTGINKELGEYFRSKYNPLPSLGDDFDLIYQDILNYCKKYDKTIVIDCAQFHCIKNINLLKGKIIIMRTCIDNCYKRCINRFKKNNPNASKEDISKYTEKKKSIYKWYKSSNKFIIKINNIKN